MKLTVHRDHFNSPEQAYDEIEIAGVSADPASMTEPVDRDPDSL